MFKNFFLWLISPKRNRYLLWGLALTTLGVFLIPFIIGIPILGIGAVLLTGGAMISFAGKIPGGKKLAEGFEEMFDQMGALLKSLFGKD